LLIIFEHNTTAHSNEVFNDAFHGVYFGLRNSFDLRSTGKKYSDCLRNEKDDYHISFAHRSATGKLTNFAATSETKSNRLLKGIQV